MLRVENTEDRVSSDSRLYRSNIDPPPKLPLFHRIGGQEKQVFFKAMFTIADMKLDRSAVLLKANLLL